MAVATFDTLKFANALKAAGVPDKQAEAHAAAFAEVVQVNFKDLATKEDLARVAANLSAEIERVAAAAKADLEVAVKDLKRDNAELRVEMKHDNTELRHEFATLRTDHKAEMLLLKWMVGACFAGIIGILTMLARLLFLQPR